MKQIAALWIGLMVGSLVTTAVFLHVWPFLVVFGGLGVLFSFIRAVIELVEG